MSDSRFPGRANRVLAKTPVLFHPAAQAGRDFVVGDMHGCIEPFWRLLSQVAFNPEIDRVFSVGDLIDRGPDSWACLRLLKMPWFFACLGNHEALLLAHLRDPRAWRAYDEAWLYHPSRSLQDRQVFAEAWIPELERLPAVHVVGRDSAERFQVVHAELLEEGVSVTDAMIDAWSFQSPTQALERATYGRSLITAYRNDKPVRRAHDPNRMSPTYCGHTILPSPAWLAGQAFIDTGAFLAHDTHLDDEGQESLTQTRPREPGLVLVEPVADRAWFAPTPKGSAVRPIPLATLDAY
jgi:serine/threonine protein phosphatase 1